MNRSPVLGMVILFLMAGCGCGSSNSSSATASLSGNWQFTVTSTAFGTVSTGTAAVTQNADALTGSATLTDDPCATTAQLYGSIKAPYVNFALVENGQDVALSGTVNSAYSSITGTYTAPAGGCTNGDYGTWTATKD